MKLEDKIYWARFLAGVVMGALTAIFKLYQPTIFLGIVVAALIYIVSAIILRAALPENARNELGRKLYTSGASAYAVMWLITLIIVFNMIS